MQKLSDFLTRLRESHGTEEIIIGKIILPKSAVWINGKTTDTKKIIEVKVFTSMAHGSLLQFEIELDEVVPDGERTLFEILLTKNEFNHVWKDLHDLYDILLRDPNAQDTQPVVYEVPNSSRIVTTGIKSRGSDGGINRSYCQIMLADRDHVTDEVVIYLNVMQLKMLLDLLLKAPIHLQGPVAGS